MSFFKSLILGSGQQAPSNHVDFDDFSNDISSDAFSQYAPEAEADQAKSAPVPAPQKSLGKTAGTGDVWMNRAYLGEHKLVTKAGKSFYDTVKNPKEEPSSWDYILKGEQMRRLAFAAFDENNDGFLDAQELRKAIGTGEDVEKLIQIADKNGDGRIDYKEFCDLLQAKQP